jgi:hypothetical protein
MPIRPEMKGRYPANWQAIRQRILARARAHCEQCGKPDRATLRVRPGGFWYDSSGPEQGCPLWGWRDSSGEWAPEPDL